MSLSQPAEAMFVLTRPKGAVQHEAILRRTLIGDVIVELHPRRGLAIRPTFDSGREEGFSIVGSVHPRGLAGADARLRRLISENPAYSVTDFNCQHLVERVVSGQHVSHQVQAVKVLAGVCLVASILIPAFTR